MISNSGKIAILEKYIDRDQNEISYDEEMNFYNSVKFGDTENVKEMLKNGGFIKNINKPLADDLIQSMKYHFVVTAAMLARFCIDGGMEQHRAYEMSDFYIRKADKAKSETELEALIEEMSLDYTLNMGKLRKAQVYSKPIIKSIDYIYSHLHCRITAAETAEYVGLNESYFSRLFCKEVGVPVSRYIFMRKIEAAQNLLKNSDYSCIEISELLSFSSQSHFISRFRKECGMTPLDYRNKYYNHTGLNEKKIENTDKK